MSDPRRPTITAVGLGPAGPEFRTQAVHTALDSGRPVYLRTAQHPGATELVGSLGAISLDSLYESGASFEDVYKRIADALVDAAMSRGDVVYAVPGSPTVAERTVELLRRDDRITLKVIAGISFCDLAWERLGIDPLAASVRMVDGTRFATEAAGDAGPLLVGQCWSRRILSEIKLAVEWSNTAELPSATLLHHLGLGDEQVVTVRWDELDRSLDPDHLTALWIPHLADPVGRELVALDELVRTLREKCPWDREQTHASLKRHLLEETYEVLDAIDGLDLDGPGLSAPAPRDTEPVDAGSPASAHLEEELGDLLFQVYFHACLAAEEGRFTLADVAGTVRTKLVARHPHVFGEVEATTAGAVAKNWEQIKKAEKGRTSVTEGIPAELPALALAAKLQRKAQSVDGATSPISGDERRRIDEYLDRLGRDGGERADPESSDVAGELLWSVSDLVRQCGIEPEDVLRQAARRFSERLRRLEMTSAEEE